MNHARAVVLMLAVSVSATGLRAETLDECLAKKYKRCATFNTSRTIQDHTPLIENALAGFVRSKGSWEISVGYGPAETCAKVSLTVDMGPLDFHRTYERVFRNGTGVIGDSGSFLHRVGDVESALKILTSRCRVPDDPEPEKLDAQERERLDWEEERDRLAWEAERERLALEEEKREHLAWEAERERLAREAELERLAREAERRRQDEERKRVLAERDRKQELQRQRLEESWQRARLAEQEQRELFARLQRQHMEEVRRQEQQQRELEQGAAERQSMEELEMWISIGQSLGTVLGTMLDDDSGGSEEGGGYQPGPSNPPTRTRSSGIIWCTTSRGGCGFINDRGECEHYDVLGGCQ